MISIVSPISCWEKPRNWAMNQQYLFSYCFLPSLCISLSESWVFFFWTWFTQHFILPFYYGKFQTSKRILNNAVNFCVPITQVPQWSIHGQFSFICTLFSSTFVILKWIPDIVWFHCRYFIMSLWKVGNLLNISTILEKLSSNLS